MRMWNVNPKCLCNQHLLGEHVETHMFVGTINKGISIKGYLKNGLLETHNLHKRHRQLVEEMKNRNMNHKSKLPKCKSNNIEGHIDINENLIDLQNRCVECKKRIKKQKENINDS